MITLRMPASGYLAAATLFLLPGAALLELAAALHSAPVGAAGLYLIFLSVPVAALNLAVWVQLEPAGVRIRTLRRSRVVSWSDVRAVTVQQAGRGRRVSLWTHAGERVLLPLPVTRKTWNQDGFLADYHRIGQYWQASQAWTGWPR